MHDPRLLESSFGFSSLLTFFQYCCWIYCLNKWFRKEDQFHWLHLVVLYLLLFLVRLARVFACGTESCSKYNLCFWHFTEFLLKHHMKKQFFFCFCSKCNMSFKEICTKIEQLSKYWIIILVHRSHDVKK